MGGVKIKIGEILINYGLITREILDEALDYQAKFGGNITQYLIAHGYIKEEDLAKCVTIQFGYPYLPLRAYDIPPSIIRLIPPAIAQKYWLIPVDKIENIITLVMADPFDEEAIKEVEKATGCKVQPFVGILSDILKAIEKYYMINIGLDDLRKGKKLAPLFVISDSYVGIERRKAVRIKAKVEMHFPSQDKYKKSETKDVSTHGLLFESENMLPIGSYLILEIKLPKKFSLYPIAAVTQVVRATPLKNGRFDIGVKLINMAKEDIDKVIKYSVALTKGHEEPAQEEEIK